jgi:biopolymer transport protein ExbD
LYELLPPESTVKVNLEPDELDVRIEMIPLVDVIFCILAFFILAAVGLARGEGLNIDLPTAETGQTQLSSKVSVEIDALGAIKVLDTPVTEEQLTQFLANYVRKNPKGVIELYADKLVSYGQVVKLIDTLQKVGGNRVSLGTQTLPSNPSTPGNALTQPQSPQPFNPSAIPNNPVPGSSGTTGIPGSPTAPLPNNNLTGFPETPGLPQQPLPQSFPTTSPQAPAVPTQP